MATSSVKPSEDEIISEIHIATKPELVFQALVDPKQVLRWWGRRGMYRCTKFQSDLWPGGKWHSSGTGLWGEPLC